MKQPDTTVAQQIAVSAESTPPVDAAAFAPRQDRGPIGADELPIFQEFIGEARGHLGIAESMILSLEANAEDVESIDSIFRCFHTIKGVAGFLNLTQVGALAHAAENLMNPVRKKEKVLAPADVDLVLRAIDQMKLLINAIADAIEGEQAIADVEGLAGLLEDLQACAARCPTKPAPPDPQPASSGGEDTRAARSAPGVATEPAKPAAAATLLSENSVNVSTERLDALINMIGELVIAQSMVSQDIRRFSAANQRLARNIAHLGKITRELQDLSMSMRMVPIQGVFQKMARLARDLSRKAQKQIKFVAIGSDTELDRNLVEAISDPLMHMVRNAIDHGIEPAEQRTAAGKDAVGLIQLKAWQQAGYFVIQLQDDGKGLDRDKIVRKAVESGLIGPDAQLSEQEIFRLIFHAGLSTAEKVTNISGRGVGMDVVLKNVEKLRGRIEIDSIPRVGATFTIRLPLTLAVIDGLIASVGRQRYIIPLSNLDASYKAQPHQIKTVQGRGELCNLREELLPLFRLHRLFDVPQAIEDASGGLVVVVQDDQRKCCLLVDAVIDQQQVVIKALGEGFGAVPGVSGAAILGDGAVSLILDVPGIIDMACEQPKRAAA